MYYQFKTIQSIFFILFLLSPAYSLSKEFDSDTNIYNHKIKDSNKTVNKSSEGFRSVNTDIERANILARAGDDYRKKKQYLIAVSKYRESLKLLKNNSVHRKLDDLLSQLEYADEKMREGQAQWKKGILDKAVLTLKEAAIIDPLNIKIGKVLRGMQGQKKMMDALLRKANKLIKEKKFDQAESVLHRAERINTEYMACREIKKELDSVSIKKLNKEKTLSFSESVILLMNFREDGYKDSNAAFVKYADTKTAARLSALGDVLSPASDASHSWEFFLGSSVASVASLNEEMVLTMLYNPWSDVALLCEWSRSNGKPKITQVKLVCGDEIRNTEIPVLLPLWRRSANIPPPLTLSVATSDTVHAFINLYGRRHNWPAKEWADMLPPLKTDNPKEDSKKIVGLFFSQNLSSINTFFNDSTYSKLKISMNEIRQQLIDGQTKDVLLRIPDTINESRTVLTALRPEDWSHMTIVSFASDAKNAFIFLSSTHSPQLIASFWFTMDNDTHATSHRIDFLKLDLSFKEVDKLARKAGMKRSKTINSERVKQTINHKNGGHL